MTNEQKDFNGADAVLLLQQQIDDRVVEALIRVLGTPGSQLAHEFTSALALRLGYDYTMQTATINTVKQLLRTIGDR